MKRTVILLVSLGLICCGMTLGVFGPVSKSEGQTQKIKLGLVYPITGPLAATGKIYVDAFKLYADLINNSYDIDSPGDIIRAKGLPRLGGAQVEIVIADSEGKPDVGRSEAERLITLEKVDFLMGAYQSAVTETSSHVAEQYKVVYVNPASSSPKLTNRGFKWFFRTGPDEWSYVGSIMQFLKDLRERNPEYKIKRLAVVAEDTLWGQDTAMVVKKKAPELGFEVVVEVTYPHEATDVEAEVLKVKRANPDAIAMASYDPDAILFQKTYKKYDVNVPIVANGTGHDKPGFVQALGADANYVMTRQTWGGVIIQKNPIAKKINELLVSRYGAGSGINDIAARTYIGFITLMDAINRAGAKNSEDVQQALLKTNIPGSLLALPWEGVKFDPQTHQNIYTKVLMTQYQNKTQKVVWPWDMAETKVVWNLPPWSKR
jgi:branched-chain amino acid transport system substrate-binding protein